MCKPNAPNLKSKSKKLKEGFHNTMFLSIEYFTYEREMQGKLCKNSSMFVMFI